MDDGELRKLVNNERLKLLATFVNSAGVAMFAVGGIAPVISGLYGPTRITAPLLVVSLVCFAGACCLHVAGSTILRGLR